MADIKLTQLVKASTLVEFTTIQAYLTQNLLVYTPPPGITVTRNDSRPKKEITLVYEYPPRTDWSL